MALPAIRAAQPTAQFIDQSKTLLAKAQQGLLLHPPLAAARIAGNLDSPQLNQRRDRNSTICPSHTHERALPFVLFRFSLTTQVGGQVDSFFRPGR